MPSSVMIILLLCFVWMLCSITNTDTTNYFNRKIWFDNGNIFHISQEQFWTAFQQHRNVNRHMDWLTNEISSLNRQIKSVKDQVTSAIYIAEQRLAFHQEKTDTIKNISLSTNDNSPKPSSSPSITVSINHQNIYILKLISHESLFHRYLPELIDIYKITLTTMTIECIAVIIEQHSNEKYLFIKLSNGNIDSYRMNKTKSLKETFWKFNQPLSTWNNAGKQLEYYRRFILDTKTNEVIVPDQLFEIKNRPKLNDVHFFDMMGQILRLKYHVDPSSLSCILEVFFENIYTCDGRLIHPHELKLLSGDNDLFVFYAVMMDTATEKQIFPLGINNHLRHGDQIFFLFNNHPQFNSLSSLTCTNCVRPDQPYSIENQVQTEQNTETQVIESKTVVDNIEQKFFITNPQNYIVYAVVTSILIYILIGIYLSRKQEESIGYLGRKHSITSRRGR